MKSIFFKLLIHTYKYTQIQISLTNRKYFFLYKIKPTNRPLSSRLDGPQDVKCAQEMLVVMIMTSSM